MNRLVFLDLSVPHGFFEQLLPLSGLLLPDQPPYLAYLPPCDGVFLFLPAPFSSQEFQSSYLLLQRFHLHRSGIFYSCFLLPMMLSLFPGLQPVFFQYLLKKLPLQISDSSLPCSFHFLHPQSFFQAQEYSEVRLCFLNAPLPPLHPIHQWLYPATICQSYTGRSVSHKILLLQLNKLHYDNPHICFEYL